VRSELARENGVPAYIIFADRTLWELAARMPRNPDELLTIHGFGRVKLEKYGAQFLRVIEDYRRVRSKG
jgi:ATP-dependent DNA helicase RecQ